MAHDNHSDHEHHGPGYWKVYWILLVLFIISARARDGCLDGHESHGRQGHRVDHCFWYRLC